MNAHTSDAHVGSFGVSSDVVIMTIRDGALRVLLVRRGAEPFAGRWALPGGLLTEYEDAASAATRVLGAKTGVDADGFHLEQLATYSAPDRDPRLRVVSVAHLAFAPDLPEAAGSDEGDAPTARWWRVEDLFDDPDAPLLAFDHGTIIRDALERVRAKLEYTTLATRFIAEPFTMAELRAVYGAVWGVLPARATFIRAVLATDGFVVPDDAPDSSAPSPTLYRRGDATDLHPAMLRSRAGEPERLPIY